MSRCTEASESEKRPEVNELSVVLISKNQAWNMARLVESVLHETAQLGETIASCEIILVDSASTDATIDIARRYPIRILRLRPDQHLGPAAGRYVGYSHTRGCLTLFMDGDTELYPGWLAKGISALNLHPDVAAVTGARIELLTTCRPEDKPPLVDVPVGQASELRQTGGIALYRRSVLEQVGCFNPYLCSDEEPDLCIRIRRAGYRLLRLEHPIFYEYTDPKATPSTKIARWKRNLYLGGGQNLRYHLGRNTFWQVLRERGFGLAPLAWLALGIGSLLPWVLTGQVRWPIAWLALSASIILFDGLRKRSFYRTWTSLVERMLIAEGTVRGFLRRPHPPESYPGRHDVIQ